MKTKKCSNCGRARLLKFYSFKNKKTGKLSAWCVDCNKEYQRQHYRRNKADYTEKAVANKRAKVRSLRKTVWEYLLRNPCVDCGEKDPVVLEFDHVRGTKKAHVSRLVSNGVAWETVVAEIAKCEVRCANCHRRRTANRAGWYNELCSSSG